MSTSEGKHGIQSTSRMQLDDLDFADDLALLSQTQQQMQEKTNSVAAASAAVGLNIHKRKSRILRYNTAYTNPITIDGDDLEDVKTFTYLGSIIDEQGGSDADVKAQIGKARSAYLQLRNIWNSKQLSTNTKCHQLLKRLVHVGRRKLEKFERHSPGKLLNRHLLCKALSTWKAMRSSQNSHNCWSAVEPTCSISFDWDEDSEFISGYPTANNRNDIGNTKIVSGLSFGNVEIHKCDGDFDSNHVPD
ncbi:unnamed protein product [Schistosoma margrebowiei]|uniref:Uncharacterized protein n=1 Tax=Schistosoma margrebowiei TaxID=48269 RepID=A0A183LM00_9TREM|nr:unnamed protein product [Schistosoma margrebowiei]